MNDGTFDHILCGLIVLAAAVLVALGKMPPERFFEAVAIVGVWLGNLHRRAPQPAVSVALVLLAAFASACNARFDVSRSPAPAMVAVVAPAAEGATMLPVVARAALHLPKGRPARSSDARCGRGWIKESWPTLTICASEDGDQAVVLATAITPFTSWPPAGTAGLPFSGGSWEVACTVTGAVTLRAAAYDASLSSPAWQLYQGQGYTCSPAASVASQGTCIFQAKVGGTLTWNIYAQQNPVGSVSACTATVRQGEVPPAPEASGGGGGGGGGTVTSITQGTGMSFSVNPIVTTGTINLANTAVTPGTYGSATQVGQFTVDQQGRLTSAGNVAISVSPTVPQLRWRPVLRPQQRPVVPSNGTSDITYGTAWQFMRELTITGITFYWATASTVTAKLWRPNGSVGASCSVVVGGAGIALCSFATPYVIPTADVGKIFITSTYDGVNYCFAAVEPAGPFPITSRNQGPMSAGPWVYEIISGPGTGASGFYAAGDAMPNFPDLDAFIEPIISDDVP